jgi:hypothetical protein
VPTDWSEIREAARTAFDEVERAALHPLHDVDEPPPDLTPRVRAALEIVRAVCIYMVVRGNER